MMARRVNRRRNREMYELPSDGAVVLLLWVLCIGVLVFTGAGEILLGRIADYVASWSYR